MSDGIDYNSFGSGGQDTSAETNLIDGNGSGADFTNLFGDNSQYTQNSFDVADNGGSTKSTNGTASTTSPSWLSSLTGLVSTGAKLYSTGKTVSNELTGKTTTAATTSAKTTKQTANTATGSSSNWKMFAIIGAAVAGLLVLVLAMRK